MLSLSQTHTLSLPIEWKNYCSARVFIAVYCKLCYTRGMYDKITARQLFKHESDWFVTMTHKTHRISSPYMLCAFKGCVDKLHQLHPCIDTSSFFIFISSRWPIDASFAIMSRKHCNLMHWIFDSTNWIQNSLSSATYSHFHLIHNQCKSETIFQVTSVNMINRSNFFLFDLWGDVKSVLASCSHLFLTFSPWTQ